MDKIKALVEQALLSEDHLTLQDKPEDAQAVKFESGGDTFEGWVAKQGEEFHVVMFKNSENVDMYVEEKCNCEDGAKSLIVQMIKTLKDTKEEASEETPVTEGSLRESDNDLWAEAIKHHKYQLRVGMSAARHVPGQGWSFDYGPETSRVRASQAALEKIIAQIMSSEGLTRDQVEYKLNDSGDSRNYLPDEYSDSLRDVGFERNNNDPDDEWEPEDEPLPDDDDNY